MRFHRLAFSTILLICIAFSYQAHSSGFIVGNGGDGVFCQASPRFPEAGIYFLDSALLTGYPVATDATISAIVTSLQKRYPKLFVDLKEFLDNRSKNDPFARRAWIPAATGLPSIYDENLLERLPVECRSETPGTSPIKQVIVRESKHGRLIYHYEPELMKQFEARPLQLSYLLVHEWLWDHTKDAQTVRILNAYLHSPNFFAETSAALPAKLYQLGFRFGCNIPNLAATATLVISNTSKEPAFTLSARNFASPEAGRLILNVLNHTTLRIRLVGIGNSVNIELLPCLECEFPAQAVVEIPTESSIWIHGKTANGDLVPQAWAEQFYVRFN